MSIGIDRQQAIALLHQYIKNPNMIKHCLAAEAVMRHLAKYCLEDEEKWAMAGLLHDLDVEITNADLRIHGQESVKILQKLAMDEDIIDAIACHNETSSNKQRQTKFHHALAAGETITGLIIATTLVYPDKKLASVKPQSILKRMKEKSFAASVNRETIKECERIGIPLNSFAEIALKAMQSISNDLGL